MIILYSENETERERVMYVIYVIYGQCLADALIQMFPHVSTDGSLNPCNRGLVRGLAC